MPCSGLSVCWRSSGGGLPCPSSRPGAGALSPLHKGGAKAQETSGGY